MDFVLDASVTMSWCFEDEVTPYAESVLVHLRENHAIVPQVWPLEVANALLVGERRGRVIQAKTEALLNGLRGLSIGVDQTAPLDAWERSRARTDGTAVTIRCELFGIGAS